MSDDAAASQFDACMKRKRRLPSYPLAYAEKRARTHDAHADIDSDASDLHSLTSLSCDEESEIVGTETPATPQSTKDWPSLRKTIPCPHPTCNKTFNRQAKVRDHLRYHTGERPFVCPETGCECSFPRKTHLDRHIKSAHTTIRDYKCEFKGCGKAFSTGTRLRRHEATHQKRLQFSCQICGQEFRKHTTLQKHEATAHEGRKPYACGWKLPDGTSCPAEFDRATGLNSHQAHAHTLAKYTCNLCPASSEGHNGLGDTSNVAFSTYSAFQEHNRIVHPPSCPHCGISCQTNKQLNRHLDIEHGFDLDNGAHADTTLHTCSEPGCHRSFAKKGNLQVHVRSVHLQMRPFNCGGTDVTSLNNIHGWTGLGACSRDFKSKAQLEEHIRTTHLGMQHRQKPKKESIRNVGDENLVAEENFTKDYLVRKLTGDAYHKSLSRNIPCLITGCSFAFTREYDLDLHLRTKHGLDDNEVQVARLSRATLPASRPNEPHEGIHTDSVPQNGMKLDCREIEVEEAADGQGSEMATTSEMPFWVGEQVNMADAKRIDQDAWDFEEAEMHKLIGDGHGWEDDIVIDPALVDLQ